MPFINIIFRLISKKKTLRSYSFFRHCRRILICLGFALFLIGSLSFGKEPQWIFNNGPDINNVNINMGTLFSEVGLMVIQSTGHDMTFSVPMSEDDSFAAEEYPFFGVRYKINSHKTQGGLFFTTDTLTNLCDDSFSSFEIIGDNEWRQLVIDMRTYPHKNWKGIITGFRLDPINPSDADSKISISRLGFFQSEKDAAAFLNAANDQPNLSLSTTFNEILFKCVIPGNCLPCDYDKTNYLLQNSFSGEEIKSKAINPQQIIVVNDKNGKEEIQPLCETTRLGFTTYEVREAGSYRLIISDVASKFIDISERPAENAIRFAVSRGIMTGVTETEFKPEDSLSEIDWIKIRKQLTEAGVPEDKLPNEKQIDGKTICREEMAIAVMNSIKETLGTNSPSNFPSEYFTRERIRLGSWGNFRPTDFNDEYMRSYQECGFDFVISMGGVPVKSLLQLGNKYGIEVYVNDGAFLNPEEATAEYCDEPCYCGHYIIDEPGTENFDKLAAECNNYSQRTGKVPYVNLLPMYANAAQLKYGAGAAAIEYYDADPDLFRKYCESFCQKFNTNYICTDIYPLNWINNKKVTYSDYIESINIIASVAREYDREFWCFIQTFGWIDSKRTPNEAEYRWQCYSMLSFGCRCILCWTYSGYDTHFPSLVDVNSQKTTAWYDIRPVFQELRRISDVFVKYRNLGAFTHRCSDETPYLKMSHPYTDFNVIQDVQCDDPLLFGCFEAKSGQAQGCAFTVVNMSDLQNNQGTTVRLKLDGKTVTAWYRGFPEIITPDANGYYVLSLASGEGVFVTVE